MKNLLQRLLMPGKTNARLLQEIDRLRQVAEMQRQISSSVSDPAKLISEVMERARQITSAAGAAVEMREGDEMVYRAASGSVANAVGVRLPVATSLSGRCTREGRALHCTDALVDERVDRAACLKLGVRSMILVPLTAGKSVVGVLKVLAPVPDAFTDADLRVLELMGGMIGAALVQAEVAEQVRLRQQAEALTVQVRTLAEAIPQIVWTATPDGALDYYNQRWFDYTGMTLEQTRGWGWGPVIHADDLQNTVARWTEAVRTGEPYEVEYRFKRGRDGAYRWHLGRASPVRDAQGNIVKWFGTGTDIEDQKRAAEERIELQRQEALRQGEVRFRNAFDHSAVGMALIELDGSWMQVNETLSRIVGLSREELLASSFRAILHPDDLAEALAHQARMIEGGVTFYELEQRYLHKSGEIVWVLLTCSLVRDAQGAPLHTIAQMQDITARRRAEEELRTAEEKLRRSETLYRAMAQNFPKGSIGLFDSELRYLAVDGKSLADVGLSGPAMVGKTIFEVYGPEYSAAIEPEYRSALAGVESTKDVLYRGHHYQRRAVPVRDSDGTIFCGMFVSMDVSDRKAAEAQVLASLREKEVLLKEIHHRVKNNLQVIGSLLNLQARKLPAGEAREALRESRSRVQAIAEFHEGIYRSADLSNLDSTQYLRSVATGVLRSFALDNVKLEVSGQASLGLDAAISCGLIVNELMTNSLKHAFPAGRSGAVQISLSRSGPAKVLLSVDDDGVGLPPDFEQRRSRTLGLELVYTLASQLGGALSVKPGAGARFELEFPLPQLEA